MTPNYLFCPNCNNQNHLPRTDEVFCHQCKTSYSFQKQVATQQLELIDKDFSPSLIMPITDRFQLKEKENRWILEVKRKGESPLLGYVIVCFFGILVIILAILLILYEMPEYILILISCVVAAFSTQENGQSRTPTINHQTAPVTFTYSDSSIKMKLKGHTRTFYGIEADDLYYEYKELQSKVKLKNPKGDETLVELLSPSEARWLTLFLKKHLKSNDIGALR